ALNIAGPTGAGKSHLATIWQDRVTNVIMLDGLGDAASFVDGGFYVLDHIQPSAAWDEEALFHLFNHCRHSGGLLLLSDQPVGQMGWQLPDLRSRLRAVTVVEIDLPDDYLLSALLAQYFTERQLVLPPAVLTYLVGRMERSFAAVQRVGAALDARSIAEKRPLSVALARSVLEDLTS
ncbi:MAG: hypothetical protein VW499_07430, partial [Candidatus Puniceispirillum sp.]